MNEKGNIKLKFNEAQELYKKIISCDNEELKKQYRDKLILGTVYFINDIVYKRNLINSSLFDNNDIINSLIEKWIEKIDEGELLKNNCFHDIINDALIKQVLNSSTGNYYTFCLIKDFNKKIDEQFYNKKELINLIYKYIDNEESIKLSSEKMYILEQIKQFINQNYSKLSLNEIDFNFETICENIVKNSTKINRKYIVEDNILKKIKIEDFKEGIETLFSLVLYKKENNDVLKNEYKICLLKSYDRFNKFMKEFINGRKYYAQHGTIEKGLEKNNTDKLLNEFINNEYIKTFNYISYLYNKYSNRISLESIMLGFIYNNFELEDRNLKLNSDDKNIENIYNIINKLFKSYINKIDEKIYNQTTKCLEILDYVYYDGITFTDIAKKYNVTREAIRFKVGKIYKKIKNYSLNNPKLKPYIKEK